jgi:hypothetical protein
VLQHDELLEIIDQALEDGWRKIDAGALRIVLVDDRDVGAKLPEELRIVIVDALVALEAGWRRHHDAGGAGDHRLVRETPRVLQPGVADADDHLAISRPRHDTLHDGERLLGRELVRFAHHAEQGEAVHTAGEIEIGE